MNFLINKFVFHILICFILLSQANSDPFKKLDTNFLENEKNKKKNIKKSLKNNNSTEKL